MTQEVTWADLLRLVDDTLADVDAATLDNLWNPLRQLFSFAQYRLPEDAADLEVAFWSSAYAELLYKARKTLYAFFYSLALVADIDEETEGDFFDLVEQYLPHPYKSDTVGKYDPVGLLDGFSHLEPVKIALQTDDTLARLREALKAHEQDTPEPSSIRGRR